MIERITDESKYQKQITWKTKVTTFLVRNALYIPFIAFFLGLGFVLWYFKDELQKQFSLEVKYEETVDISDYVMKARDNLAVAKEKISERKKDKSKGRYTRFISGSEVVGVDFGQVIYSDEEAKQAVPNTTATTDTTVFQPVAAPDTVKIIRTIIKHVPVAQAPLIPDTLSTKDTTLLAVDTSKQVPVFFASQHLGNSSVVDYTAAYVYGDQEIVSGSFVRFRLSEDLSVNNQTIPRGTVFRGVANLSQNVIQITIDRIDRYDVDFAVYDRDYSYGIILEKPRNEDMNDALRQSAYRSSNRTVADLPYEIAQDVTRSIVRNKKRKERAITLNNGDPVYIALNQP